jgi:hypothetical protein
MDENGGMEGKNEVKSRRRSRWEGKVRGGDMDDIISKDNDAVLEQNRATGLTVLPTWDLRVWFLRTARPAVQITII